MDPDPDTMNCNVVAPIKINLFTIILCVDFNVSPFSDIFYVRLKKYLKDGEHRFHCIQASRPSALEINKVFVGAMQ